MKKDEIKQKRPFAPGIQWQLMLFIGGITLFTLLLVWGIITYALEPQYNRNIRAKLDSKAAAITALIDQSDAEISSRTYQGLYLNDEFWSGVSQTFQDKKINVDGNCMRAPARSAGSSATIWTPALPFSCGKSCFRTARCTRS